MKRLLALLVLALSALGANAATTYFNDCGTGSTTGCVSAAAPDGSIANPYKTGASFQTVFNAAQPGDQILFAQCGAINGFVTTGLHNAYSGTSSANLAAMAANPIIIQEYTPAGCTGSPKPRLNSSIVDGDSIFYFYAGSGQADGGYTIRNLRLESTGYHNASAIGMLRWSSFVVFDNLTINGFGGAGITCGGQPTYGYPNNVTLKNSTFTNNGTLGIGFFGCSNVTIDNNTLDNNGYEDVTSTLSHNHSIYVSGTDQLASAFAGGVPQVSSAVVIRNNTITRNSLCPSVGTNGYNAASSTCSAPLIGLCASTVIVGHDRAQDWIIENNKLMQTSGTSSGGCWGIEMDSKDGGYSEYQKRLVVRGNTIANVGNQALIFQGGCQNCLLENNNVFWESSAVTSAGGGMTCIYFGHRVVNATPEANFDNTAATVRNNTCWFAATTAASFGVIIAEDGTNHIVENNLIVFDLAGTNAGAECFNTNLTGALGASAFTRWNYNLCNHFSTWGNGGSKATWSGAAATLNFDANSIASSVSTASLMVGSPSYATPGNAAITFASAAKAAGIATQAAPRDITTCLRPSPPSIGAYEYFASACGTKPAGSGTQLR